MHKLALLVTLALAGTPALAQPLGSVERAVQVCKHSVYVVAPTATRPGTMAPSADVVEQRRQQLMTAMGLNATDQAVVRVVCAGYIAGIGDSTESLQAVLVNSPGGAQLAQAER